MGSRLRLGAALGVLMLVAPGCVSRLAGERRRSVPPGTESLRGIPFTMTKPVFFITATPGPGGTAKYELKVEWVADTDHQYTVTLDPSLFADSGLLMNLGEHGETVDLNATITDKAGPTIQAIGEFIGGIAGTAAGIAFPVRGAGNKDAASEGLLKRLETWRDDKSEPGPLVWDPAFLQGLNAGQDAYGACKYKSMLDNHWRPATTVERAALAELIKSLKQTAGAGQTTTNILKALPFPAAQRLWLESARELLACEAKERAANVTAEERAALERLTETFKKLYDALAEAKKKAKQEMALHGKEAQAKATIEAIDDVEGELRKLEILVKGGREIADPKPSVNSLVVLLDVSGYQAIRTIVLAVLAPAYPPPTLKEGEKRTTENSISPLLVALPLAERAARIDAIAGERAVVKALLDADDLWTYRLVVGLEAEIDGLRRALAHEPIGSSPLEDQILEKQRGVERLIGAREDGERVRAVLVQLKEMESKTRAFDSKAYAALTQTLTTITASIQQKRAAVRPPDPPVGPPKRFPVTVIDCQAGTKPEDIQKAANGAEYILLRERGYNR